MPFLVISLRFQVSLTIYRVQSLNRTNYLKFFSSLRPFCEWKEKGKETNKMTDLQVFGDSESQCLNFEMYHCMSPMKNVSNCHINLKERKREKEKEKERTKDENCFQY
jgi:hypothetical protein